MIIQSVDGNIDVRQRSGMTTMTTPGSWESAMLGSLGVTRWTTGWGPGDRRTAIALAAVAAAVRIISESVGSMVLRVYRGDALEKQPVYDAPQARLFQNPAPGVSSFDFWQGTSAAIEVASAAFIYKIRDQDDQVVELLPLDPDYFRISGTAWDRKVSGWQNGKAVDVTRDVIVLRSWSPQPSADGVSTLSLHEKLFGRALGYEEYQGRYFKADGTVDQAIIHGPGEKSQRDEMLAGWILNRRKYNIGVLWGDTDLKQMNPSLRDSQAAELATNIRQEVATAFRIVPANLLYAETQPERFPSLEMVRGIFYSFSLFHRLRRIERALAADDDLFPDKSLSPSFDVAGFVKADTATLATAAHAMRQDGSLTGDEQRALVLGLANLPGGQGQHIQQTPVGGAPNADAAFAAELLQLLEAYGHVPAAHKNGHIELPAGAEVNGNGD